MPIPTLTPPRPLPLPPGYVRPLSNPTFASIIEVASFTSHPLRQAVYGSDFWRGTVGEDGMSFFVGEDRSTPRIFSVIGEVKSIRLDEYGLVLMLGKPAGCSSMMDLFWRQQIAALEKVELEDIFADQGLHTTPQLERWVNHLHSCDDRMRLSLFARDTTVEVVNEELQPIAEQAAVSRGVAELMPGDLVYCRVVLGSQQNVQNMDSHYFLFGLSVNRVQVHARCGASLAQWQRRMFA
ncbi:hypothetical protein JOM56_014952 [Amanita muscaria]